MINSPQLYRQFKEVERPTCYHYEGREGGRAHVEGDDQNPTIYVFQASQLPDNLNILPSSKSALLYRDQAQRYCPGQCSEAHSEQDKRPFVCLSLRHKLNIDNFLCSITSFIVVTDITHML
mgnify:CR=1 FL=1